MGYKPCNCKHVDFDQHCHHPKKQRKYFKFIPVWCNGECDLCEPKVRPPFRPPGQRKSTKNDELDAISRGIIHLIPEISPVDNEINKETGLTEQEQKVMDASIQCHSAYLELNTQHPDELKELTQAINKIQDLLALRVVRRDYPNGWASTENKPIKESVK